MQYQLKKIVPASFLQIYHSVLSWFAAVWYGHPSEKLIVVGVTGTNGKTTTSYLIAKALEATGERTGCTTTALFKIGSREWLNDTKMTMPGRFQLQKLLREMVKAGCRYAVVETSSQGVVQHRHANINYDVAVFTNLTPEHVEAHGSFEAYKQAKLELFRHLARGKRKYLSQNLSISSEQRSIPKVAVLNRMSDPAKDFVLPGLDKIVWYGIGSGEGVSAIDLRREGWGTSFTVDGHRGTVNLPGEVNVENAIAAVAVARVLDLPLSGCLKKISVVGGLPGRFELIDLDQPYTVVVDYAVEPVAMEKLYRLIESLPHERIIHVFGSCGGGRDVWRRAALGKLVAAHAQIALITNEDPYDDDPMAIINDIVAGAREGGMSLDAIKTVPDRRDAVFIAMREARPGDVVLLTGKGCEQAIAVAGGRRIPWDERAVAREAIEAAAIKS